VTSVDGVNIVSGETAAWDQGGYVFSPGDRYQITGWRKSRRGSGRLYLHRPRELLCGAHRAARERRRHRVAVFRERQPTTVDQPLIGGQNSSRSDAARAAEIRADVSTVRSRRAASQGKTRHGHGQRRIRVRTRTSPSRPDYRTSW